MFISHHHGLDDGFANLEEGTGWFEDDRASTASVVHRFVINESAKTSEAPFFSSKVRYSALKYSFDCVNLLKGHPDTNGP